MPVRKHQSQKNISKGETQVPKRKRSTPSQLKIEKTAQTPHPRVNALATAGKKKKPK